MEQALVFASIILGVAVAAELGNLHKLIRSHKVRWHWAQPVFALYTLLGITFYWWLIANGSDTPLSLGEFLPTMFQLVLWVLLAAVCLPDSIPEDGVDLAAYYQANNRYQWGLVALIFGSLNVQFSIALGPVIDGFGTYLAIMGFNWLFVALAISLMFVSRWWYVALAYLIMSVGPLFFWVRQSLG